MIESLTFRPVLKAEMETCMRLLGAKSISDLGPKFVSGNTTTARIQDCGETSDANECRRSTPAQWREISTTASLASRIELACG